MSIHYKFKSANQFDTVTFDGLHISVKDLKKQIMHKKKFGKSTDFDLQITNAQTKETYTNESDLIPKNTSLIVARVPIATPTKKQWDRDNQSGGGKNNDADDSGILNKSVNLAALDISEEEKIKTMMSQSTSDYDPSNYVKVKGGNQVGPVPVHYVCYKCHQRGHWIKDCKATVDGPIGMPDAIKKSSGIPRSFMIPVEGPSVPGARLTPTGQFAVPVIDLQVYKEKKVEKPPFLAEKEKPAETPSLPEDLLCVICKDLMQDAVMAPCCGNSFCDECIRNLLVESEEAECPECNEKEVSPDELIPNRFIRKAVNNFKNKTGYIKKIDGSSSHGPTPPRPSLPDFVPPISDGDQNGDGTIDKSQPAVASPLDESIKKKDEESEGKETSEKGDRSPSRSRDRERRSTSRSKENRRNRKGDGNDELSSLSSKGSPDSKGSPSQKESQKEAYNIPSVGQSHISGGPPYGNNYPPMNRPPYMRHDRSGTPTVDERYDPYGRPPVLPLMGSIPGPMYNPHYPPPMYPYGNHDMRERSRSYRGRYHSSSYGDRSMRPNLPTDQEAAYQYFQNMLQKKDEWERQREKKKHPRSRSRSRLRSISRPRSRSRSNPKLSPSGRRRSYTPKRSRSRSRRSRSGSRSPRARSFVLSRSRSRSYTPKSPIDRKLSPRKFPDSSRSPPRHERGRDYYGPDPGGYDWDRKDRRPYRPKPNRPPSPRHYSTYYRYRDEYDVPPGRVSPLGYNDRSYAGRYDGRSRRRTRSKSPPKTFYDDNGRHGEGRDVRSGSRGRREKSHETRHRSREVRSRERSGRRNSQEKGRERDKDRRKRDVSPERKRISKERSRSKTPRRSRSREQKRHSESPRRDGNRSAAQDDNFNDSKAATPVRDELTTGDKLSSPGNEQAFDEPPINKHLWKPIAENRFETDPLDRNPSPMVSDKSPKSASKKDKRKDKDKKKRKKEKETDEEREARKKKKKEKKEEKKRKEASAVPAKDENRPADIDANVNNDDERKLVDDEQSEPVDDKIKQSVDKNHSEPEPDDVLDLHPSNEDLDASEMLAPMPGLSRWELDENMAAGNIRQSSPEQSHDNTGAVTNEVIKRAENAIFKKAISAIRPEQLGKKQSDKLDDRKSRYPSDSDKDRRDASAERDKKRSSSAKKSASKDDSVAKASEETRKRSSDRDDSLKRPSDETSRRVEVKEKQGKSEIRKPGNSIQITIPVTIEKDERDKASSKISPHPRLSILERLGGKVDEPPGQLPKPTDERANATAKKSYKERSSMETSDDRSQSPEARKRRRSSSATSDDSVKAPKRKNTKHKKDKKTKKKHRKEASESSDSSGVDDKRRRRKAKKNKRSRH